MNPKIFNTKQYNGIVASNWIQELEESDSRLHKESVIEKALVAAELGSASAEIFLFNCFQAYNPFYVFGIRQVRETQGIENSENPWTEFWDLLLDLKSRKITGNLAREQVLALSYKFDSDEWNNLARRVLIKDLRCGISEKTLNKVLKKTIWEIPVFSCQLAQDSTDHPRKLQGIKRLEVKLDGVRTLAIVSNNLVTLYSRNGKVFENFENIELELKKISNKHSIESFVLDGEIVGESFQTLMRQAHRKNDIQTQEMVYHIFDFIPLDDFTNGFCNSPLTKRLEQLEEIKHLISENDSLKIVPGMNVDLNLHQGHDVMRRFAQSAVEQGYEGIMIKSVDAPYECKRSNFWLKYKPVYDFDLKVVAVEEGTGKNLGRLGALVCEGIDKDKFIRVNVGSGFTDQERDDYWHHKRSLIGQTVVVLCDSITKNQDGGYSLRFPRFKSFRDDK
jgi:DNA ligase-1